MRKTTSVAGSLLGVLAVVAIAKYARISNANYEINGARYDIPRQYAAPREPRYKLSDLSESDAARAGFDREGPFLFVHFENEELAQAVDGYASNFIGDTGFEANTHFGVQVFTSNWEGTFRELFEAFLPAAGEGVLVQYEPTPALYKFEKLNYPYEIYYAAVNPYEEGFEGYRGELLVRCHVWSNSLTDNSCVVNIKQGDVWFGFDFSQSNLEVYKELIQYFFQKLESWRVQE